MPRAGDRVSIGNAGAYTTCYSGRSAFNGYPAPAVKITRSQHHPAARHEGTYHHGQSPGSRELRLLAAGRTR